MSDPKVNNVHFDEKTKARLKAFFPIVVSDTFKYVPEIYREKDSDGKYLIDKKDWPIFELRLPNGIDHTEWRDTKGSSFGTVVINYARRCLVKWTNWKNEDGNSIEWKSEYRVDGELTDLALGMIPYMLMCDIANTVIANRQLSPEELSGLGF
jgi:hypothetical protein